METRAVHLIWCKNRALDYLARGNRREAFFSMCSDLAGHEETAGHAGIVLGMQLFRGGHLETPEQMREFILGFH